MENKPTWQLAEQICEVPAIDEAIRTFVEDNTGDNAIGLVLAVLEHQAATEAAKATGTAGELPPLPEYGDYGYHTDSSQREKGQQHHWSTEQMSAYGRQCADAARQPVPALPAEHREIIERAVRYISNSHHTHIERDTMLDELGEVLAATAAPVEQPHYRMNEKPTAWLHTLPEGKFFNGTFSDNSQIIRYKDEADSECYFHGGTLTPLFTAELTQAGLDYINEKADELHKKIVGSQP